MAKFAVIAVVNLLIIGLISGNAALSLIDGSGAGVWSWLIAAGLPLIALAVLVKGWRDLGRDRAIRARALPPPAIRDAMADEDDGGARMRSRLQRVQRVEPDAPVPAQPVPAQSVPPQPVPARPVPATSAVSVLSSRADDPAGGDDDGRGGREWDWLFGDGEDVAITAAAEDSGFPWVAAGIDHACEALLTGGHLVSGSALQADAGAWRSVVAGLARGQVLDRADAAAFGAWLAQCIEDIGPDARSALTGAMEALALEAGGDPAVAAALPRRFHAAGGIPAPLPQAG